MTDLRPFSALCNGIRLSGLEAGPPDGPPVVLLHGFPEFSYSWRHQLPTLAAAGFRAIAPDLRGYNRSDKPPKVADYRIEHLVDDVAALVDQRPNKRAHLVGHDWGGGVAWCTAMWRPHLVSKLAILNAPHPAAYLRELRRGPQLLRSYYIFFFQFPRLPEALIRFNHFSLARKTFRTGPARTSEADVQRYVAALAQPGALTATINWYRAAFRRRPSELKSKLRAIELPTLILWGDRDPFLVRELTEGLDPWLPNLRIEHFPNATHWLQHDEPEAVGRHLVDFFSTPT